MKITFVTAGGTIDKDYATVAGTHDFHIDKPAVSKIMNVVNPNFDFEVVEVLQKDSLDMDDADRQKMLEACKVVQNDKIVITHGTDTMTSTAKVLSEIKNKTIVLTGSSTPEVFRDSNAHFNVGMAICAVETLPNGIYITMNGRVYDWNKVQKAEDGVFVEV